MKKKHHFRGKFYSSGDKQIDWLFRRFISILNEKVDKIIYRTPIRDYEKPRKTLLGQLPDEDINFFYGNEIHHFKPKCIYIDPNPKLLKKEETDIISILIHELCHYIYSDLIKETPIILEDKILSDTKHGFTERQKRALSRYLPHPKKLEAFLKNPAKYKRRMICPAEIS